MCHASALERFMGKHSLILVRFQTVTLIHRLDMSTSVNEQPHVTDFHSSDGLMLFVLAAVV